MADAVQVRVANGGDGAGAAPRPDTAGDLHLKAIPGSGTNMEVTLPLASTLGR
jgi:hypothetical protein